MSSFLFSCPLRMNLKYLVTLFLEYLCCLLDLTLKSLGHLRVSCSIEVMLRKFKQLGTSSIIMILRSGYHLKVKKSKFQEWRIKLVNLCIPFMELSIPSMTVKERFLNTFLNGMKTKRKTGCYSQMSINLSKTMVWWHLPKQWNFPSTLSLLLMEQEYSNISVLKPIHHTSFILTCSGSQRS